MKYFLMIITLVALFSCGGQRNEENKNAKPDEGRIYISGAFALYPLGVKWAEEFRKEFPNIKIDISAGGAGKGMTDVLSGMVDIAMVSREVHPEETSQGAWTLAVARDAVFPVINTQNPVYPELQKRGLKKSEFESLFIQGTSNWKSILGKDIRINIFTRSDACGAAEMWAAFCGGKQEALKGTGVFGDPGMAEAVRNDVNGVGYNNLIYLYDIRSGQYNAGLAAIPIDLNENGQIDSVENIYGNLSELKKAINEGRFPMPPARDLYFVCKGKPQDGPVKTFLDWVLTKGLNYIDEAGYVALPDSLNEVQKTKLK